MFIDRTASRSEQVPSPVVVSSPVVVGVIVAARATPGIPSTAIESAARTTPGRECLAPVFSDLPSSPAATPLPSEAGAHDSPTGEGRRQPASQN